MRVLLIEDDIQLSTVLTNGLGEQGYSVARAGTYDSGLTHAMRDDADVIILDVMLPGGTGFRLCRALRRREISTPILMLTARDTVDDRVEGLDAGADDYLTKPFALRELLARLRALTRRPAAHEAGRVRVADLVVDLSAHRVWRADNEILLTAKEFALLECFVRHEGRVVDRAMITAHVWDDNHDPFSNVLEVLIRRLRRKIDDDFSVKLVHTLRGAGYRFGVTGE